MKSHLFRLINSIFLLAGVFALVQLKAPPSTAYACTPPPGGLPKYTLGQHVEMAPIVLEGKVIAVDQSTSPITATIEVIGYFKGGSGPSALTVGNFGGSWMCLSMVYLGDHIILFASGDPSTGQLTAFYASQFDAVTPATPENLEMLTSVIGHGPLLPESSAPLQELASGGEIEHNRVSTIGSNKLCLSFLLTPIVLGGVFVMNHSSKK